jgi:aspartate/methionine/tyrosine aminotransferase
MQYRRMPIEIESPEQMGYDKIRNNLSESSYTDAHLRDFLKGGSADLGDLLLCYGSHQGHDGLRELIVKDGGVLNKDHVLLTIGAAGALFIIATTLLEKGDELIVVRPNYATNIETPRAIGATIKFIDLQFENNWALDLQQIKKAITPQTRYISVTHPHNPTGACLEEAQLKELVRIADTHGLYVLVDETYRDMVFGRQLPLAVEYSPRIISVSSLSKTYGLPGLRTGWIICRDKQLLETFLAAKEQMHICGPVLDEELAYRYLLHRNRHFPRIREDIAEKFNIVKSWISRQDEWEWVEPQGGCVCFPRMRQPEKIDCKKFYHLLLEKHGTYVGPGHWFEMPAHYMRIGFGWPSPAQLEEGLKALSAAFHETATGY